MEIIIAIAGTLLLIVAATQRRPQPVKVRNNRTK
jgi:hypothetical protein